MKLIMENWRGYLLKEERPATLQVERKDVDFVKNRILKKLYFLGLQYRNIAIKGPKKG